MTEHSHSDSLMSLLISKAIRHRFIEFEGPVKTVELVAKEVPAEKIVKSIVLVTSGQKPVLAILPAKSRVSYKKLGNLLAVKDIRLANPSEVLQYSGYPAGGVSPFNNIRRTIMDSEVLQNADSICDGGDPNKLLELGTRYILEFTRPLVADLSQTED